MKPYKPAKEHSSKKKPTKTAHNKKKGDIRVEKKNIDPSRNFHTFLKISSRFFLTLAIISFIIYFNLLLVRTFPVPKKATLAATDTKHIQPVEIIIKDVGLDVPIYPARITHGSFDTSTQGASYLASSSLPGQTGNSVIYAHNWWNLFGNLYNIKKGEKVEVIFSDKHTKTFTVASTQTVHANQVSILNNTTDKRLTLFTCTDFLDADRFVVTAFAN